MGFQGTSAIHVSYIETKNGGFSDHKEMDYNLGVYNWELKIESFKGKIKWVLDS